MKIQVSNWKSLLLSLLLIVGVSFSVSAQEVSKQVTGNYEVTGDYNLGIENKYGQIEILNWNKNELDVVVDITVGAQSEKRALNALDEISVDIDEGSDGVYFTTEFGKIQTNNVDIQVTYTVKMPVQVNVELSQKYGDLFIQEVAGLADLTVKYGSLKVGALTRGDAEPWNTVDLAYGDGSIENAGYMSLDIAYSELTLTESKALNIENAYSKIFGEKAGIINTEGKYDQYNFEKVESFDAALKYSGINIGTLLRSLDVELAYTNAKIGKVQSGFDRISVEAQYGNVKAGLDPDAAFTVDAQAKYGNIRLPEGDLDYDRDGAALEVSGSVGRNPGSLVSVDIKYGNFELK